MGIFDKVYLSYFLKSPKDNLSLFSKYSDLWNPSEQIWGRQEAKCGTLCFIYLNNRNTIGWMLGTTWPPLEVISHLQDAIHYSGNNVSFNRLLLLTTLRNIQCSERVNQLPQGEPSSPRPCILKKMWNLISKISKASTCRIEVMWISC